jgi:hypothetical protein
MPSGPTVLLIWGYYGVAIIAAALNPKILGATVAFCIGVWLAVQYEASLGLASGLFAIYVISWVVASFRD